MSDIDEANLLTALQDEIERLHIEKADLMEGRIKELERQLLERDARVKELVEGLEIADIVMCGVAVPHAGERKLLRDGVENTRKVLSTKIPSVALQRALLEARIDERSKHYYSDSLQCTRLEELRAELAALGE